MKQLIFFLLISTIYGQTEKLRVGCIVNRPPFVAYDRTGQLDGYSIMLWEEIARIHGWDFEYVMYEESVSQNELCREIAEGVIDLGIGAISKTEYRERLIDFSHSVFRATLGIVVVGSSENFIVRLVTSHTFLTAVCLLFLVVFCVAHMFWYFEGGKTKNIKKAYFPGIWSSCWWVSVTLTTVGYGDVVPRTKSGNIVGFCWMFSGIFIIGIISGAISSLLTVGSLNGVEFQSLGDFRPNRIHANTIGTINQSTSDIYLRTTPIDVNASFYSIDKMLQDLQDLELSGVFYDRQILEFMLFSYKSKFRTLVLVDSEYSPQDYAIALSPNGTLKEFIDLTILELEETGYIRNITDYWFTYTERVDIFKVAQYYFIVISTILTLLTFFVGYCCAQGVAKKEKKKRKLLTAYGSNFLETVDFSNTGEGVKMVREKFENLIYSIEYVPLDERLTIN